MMEGLVMGRRTKKQRGQGRLTRQPAFRKLRIRSSLGELIQYSVRLMF